MFTRRNQVRTLAAAARSGDAAGLGRSFGNIQFVYEDKVLFPGSAELPAGGFYLSLIDFGNGVYTILVRESFEQMPDGSATSFRQADDALEINFEKNQGQVTITTNLSRSVVLDVPEQLLVIGLNQFLSEFGREIERRVPELLDWESAAVLKV